ncbi:MAG: SDR family oxidoreductase [Sphingomonadales bacterium]
MPETWNFENQTAIVTGGAQGIGGAIAGRLVDCGADVHVFDMKAGDDSRITYHELDIRNSDQVAQTTADLPDPATLLVNNAGITRDRTLVKMSDQEWRDVIDVNLTGAFNLMHAVAPGMIARGRGRIVNITSINGIRGKFGQSNYAASKAGLIGLSKTAARELGRKGITVNVVAPGMVLTELAMSLPQEYRDAALKEAVLGELADPGDIANAVLFLLSDAARMITGEVVRVDAGQYL